MRDPLFETPQKKSILYQGRFLKYHLDEVVLPNGKIATREYLSHPGAAAAIPILDDGRIMMVKQYRYATGSIQLEIPAGKLDPGETPEDCICRELSEEIGFLPKNIQHLISFWTTPSFTNEVIHLYLATGLTQCSIDTDEDEFLEIIPMTKEQLLLHVQSGAIIDAKTALAISIMELQKLW